MPVTEMGEVNVEPRRKARLETRHQDFRCLPEQPVDLTSVHPLALLLTFRNGPCGSTAHSLSYGPVSLLPDGLGHGFPEAFLSITGL